VVYGAGTEGDGSHTSALQEAALDG